MNYLKVPLSRVGAVIGPKGKTKRKLEQLSGCKLLIESDEGIIEISEQNIWEEHQQIFPSTVENLRK